MGLGNSPDQDISQRGKAGKAATESREAHGECVELAPALGRGGWPESASKLAALHTLREVRHRSGTAGHPSLANTESKRYQYAVWF